MGGWKMSILKRFSNLQDSATTLEEAEASVRSGHTLEKSRCAQNKQFKQAAFRLVAISSTKSIPLESPSERSDRKRLLGIVALPVEPVRHKANERFSNSHHALFAWHIPPRNGIEG